MDMQESGIEQKGLSSSMGRTIFLCVCMALIGLFSFVFLYKKVWYEQTGSELNQVGSFDFKPISDDEKGALKGPFAEKSDDSNELSYVEYAQKTATSSNSLAVGAGCVVSPVVLKVTKGMEIELKNFDSVPHTITVNADATFTVPAAGNLKINTDFGEPGGIYGYLCEGKADAAGMFLFEAASVLP